MPRQPRLALRTAHKTDVRAQFGALVWRVRKGKTQILLITSRGRGRWIIPKGWPVDGATPARAAAAEAWEEAGVRGRVHGHPLGLYFYAKRRPGLDDLPCLVMVYPVEAHRLETEFPEAGQRRRKWFSPKKAAARLDPPDLAAMARNFDPRALQ
nr:NUDIX hydrolase [Salinihabitans flavidus]